MQKSQTSATACLPDIYSLTKSNWLSPQFGQDFSVLFSHFSVWKMNHITINTYYSINSTSFVVKLFIKSSRHVRLSPMSQSPGGSWRSPLKRVGDDDDVCVMCRGVLWQLGEGIMCWSFISPSQIRCLFHFSPGRGVDSFHFQSQAVAALCDPPTELTCATKPPKSHLTSPGRVERSAGGMEVDRVWRRT